MKIISNSHMNPNSNLITIKNNQSNIINFLKNVIIKPHKNLLKWSKITNQTPSLKIGYPGQHLVSIITGMKGTGTGARGLDIIDGTEVKSCNRIDQVDKCNSCNSNVLRSLKKCPYCKSRDIKRNNDSKWLITISDKEDLKNILRKPRIMFLIFDYPDFSNSNFNKIRIRCFEIWNITPRTKNFKKLLYQYYNNIFIPNLQKKIQKGSTKKPAPKNFWPDSFQFYMCNPIKIFECEIDKFNTQTPKINILTYIQPADDRNMCNSEDMPSCLLNDNEKDILRQKGFNNFAVVSEDMRRFLKLRKEI